MPRFLSDQQFARVGRVVRAVENTIGTPATLKRGGIVPTAVAAPGVLRYVLKSDWADVGGVPEATADITDPEGDAVISADATIRDPREYMTDQLETDEGECYEYNGVYYALQAPCTSSDSGSNPGTGGTGSGGTSLTGATTVLIV